VRLRRLRLSILAHFLAVGKVLDVEVDGWEAGAARQWNRRSARIRGVNDQRLSEPAEKFGSSTHPPVKIPRLDFVHFAHRARGRGPRRQHLQLRTNNILTALGGAPTIPNSEGNEYNISSDDFFQLEYQSKLVCDVSAGCISVKLTEIIHTLGSEIHRIRQDKVLPGHHADRASI
jgi:hypothetical protein